MCSSFFPIIFSADNIVLKTFTGALTQQKRKSYSYQFLASLSEDEYWFESIPGHRRQTAAEGRRASHAKHWLHFALWEHSPSQEDVPEQNADGRGGQSHR